MERLKNFLENVFSWRSLEKFLWRPFFFGLDLEHSCPWPRECLSSEKLSLASDFFCVLGLGLGLEPCVLDSTFAIISLSAFHFWVIVREKLDRDFRTQPNTNVRLRNVSKMQQDILVRKASNRAKQTNITHFLRVIIFDYSNFLNYLLYKCILNVRNCVNSKISAT